MSKYFYPAATELLTDGVPVLEATFRGRLLRGNTHVLPEGNTGARARRAVVAALATRLAVAHGATRWAPGGARHAA